jgi:hypothetical protein
MVTLMLFKYHELEQASFWKSGPKDNDVWPVSSRTLVPWAYVIKYSRKFQLLQIRLSTLG